MNYQHRRDTGYASVGTTVTPATPAGRGRRDAGRTPVSDWRSPVPDEETPSSRPPTPRGGVGRGRPYTAMDGLFVDPDEGHGGTSDARRFGPLRGGEAPSPSNRLNRPYRSEPVEPVLNRPAPTGWPTSRSYRPEPVVPVEPVEPVEPVIPVAEPIAPRRSTTTASGRMKTTLPTLRLAPFDGSRPLETFLAKFDNC